jgi:hypothetical protein
MAQGSRIMHMSCHGASLYWQLTKLFSSNIYAVENTLGLYRNSPAVIFTDACHVNDFSQSSFLGKGFLKSATNTIAFLGCASYGIGDRGITITRDKSIISSTEIIDTILAFDLDHLRPYYSLGDGYKNMKNDFVKNISNSPNDEYFWMIFSYNMLGDPNAKLYIRQPENIMKPRTYATKELFTIENDTLSSFSIIEKEGSFHNVYKPLSNSHGIIEFHNVFDSLRIGYFNRKTFLQIINLLLDTDLYLYNTSINNSGTYKYRNFHIGKMPDNSLSTGTVTIRSGANQAFIYSGELNIYRSFTCEQGAELIIRPTN